MEGLIVYPDFRNRCIGMKLMHGIEKHFPEAEGDELCTGHMSERTFAPLPEAKL